MFNMGIGMGLIVSDDYAEAIQSRLQESGTAAHMIGEIVEGTGRFKSFTARPRKARPVLSPWNLATGSPRPKTRSGRVP